MVRTLGFHPNNEGSIPSSLKFISIRTRYKQLNTRFSNKKTFLKRRIHYSLKFASIISPGDLFNFQMSNSLSPTPRKSSGTNKLYVKQSYMLLTWILYLKNLGNRQLSSSRDLNSPSFFVFPKAQKKLTITKSPMAHKTFSQEQYLFKFYILSVSYSTRVDEKVLPVAYPSIPTSSMGGGEPPLSPTPSVNSSLLFILKQRMSFSLNLGTNLFFLKKFTTYST
jgi:hypothetical protein